MGKGTSPSERLRDLTAELLDDRSWKIRLPTEVVSRDGGETGIPTGVTRPCPGGCTTEQIEIRWPDGQLTWICQKLLEPIGDEREQII